MDIGYGQIINGQYTKFVSEAEVEAIHDRAAQRLKKELVQLQAEARELREEAQRLDGLAQFIREEAAAERWHNLTGHLSPDDIELLCECSPVGLLSDDAKEADPIIFPYHCAER